MRHGKVTLTPFLPPFLPIANDASGNAVITAGSGGTIENTDTIALQSTGSGTELEILGRR